jgi:hypothetical protein
VFKLPISKKLVVEVVVFQFEVPTIRYRQLNPLVLAAVQLKRAPVAVILLADNCVVVGISQLGTEFEAVLNETAVDHAVQAALEVQNSRF